MGRYDGDETNVGIFSPTKICKVRYTSPVAYVRWGARGNRIVVGVVSLQRDLQRKPKEEEQQQLQSEVPNP